MDLNSFIASVNADIVNKTVPHSISAADIGNKFINLANLIALQPTILADGVVNVKSFGAKGDGMTDDYSAINSAINSGTNSIYIPKGIYLVSQEINIPSNIRLFGDGWESVLKFTRINNSDNHQSGYILKGVDIENTTIENIKIDCSATRVIIAAVRFEGAKNLLLNNVWLDQPYNGGIQFGGPQFFDGVNVSENCIARKCKVTNVQYYNQSTGFACFIAAGGSKNCVFEDCVVETDICDAYSSDYAYDTRFIRCSFLGSAGAGFTAEGEQTGDPRTVYYEGCTADLNGKAGTGFFISENTNAVITNCTVKNVNGTSVTAGLFLQNRNTTITNCKFFNINTPTGGYGGGAIFVQSNANAGALPVVKVSDCEFTNNTFDINNYNAGSDLVVLEFTNCTFNSPVNSYFVSGMFDVKYSNCIFNSTVNHDLQSHSSTFVYAYCKFYALFSQGINGVDSITINNCNFYDGTNTVNGSKTKTAIAVAGGSPAGAIKINFSNFYGFKSILTGDDAGEVSFYKSVFNNCTNLPNTNQLSN